jgi:predicted O-methyltransferase YrrM
VQGERETVVVNALRILAHTQQVDPDFMRYCIDKARAPVDEGFCAMLEQDEREFSTLLTHSSGCRSALEIGSRYGKSIERIAATLAPRSKVVAVDLPYATGVHASYPDPAPILRATMAQIAEHGHEVHLCLGDSHNAEVIEAVRKHGPYEFVFIDGDHSYEGVKADWENYGPLATKIVAFHDIVNNPECFRLWSEIKAAGYKTAEYTESCWLGIGVVFKDNQGSPA